ncbi:hypothetical protein TWF970_006106 [Orbilia oligospora]|uniref:Uncharacterized protein n=1 Tax=Orbilia oligospora TaxID=2813651 RepID=A0A7C8RC04_ORBOL|nr:hypothetical protein TWF970_006106 [Orbilia oligospora]
MRRLYRHKYPNFLNSVGAIRGATSPGALKLKVVQPPCGYYGDTISSLQSRKEEAESRLKVVENKYEIPGEPTPAASIKLWSSCIMDVEKRLSHISQFVRDFGEVVATSGYRVHPGTENNLDWGIFRVREHRTAINMIMTEFEREGVWKSLRSAPCLHPDTSDPVLDEEVAKIGMKIEDRSNIWPDKRGQGPR